MRSASTRSAPSTRSAGSTRSKRVYSLVVSALTCALSRAPQSSNPLADSVVVPRNIMCSSACASPVFPCFSYAPPKRYHMFTAATGAA